MNIDFVHRPVTVISLGDDGTDASYPESLLIKIVKSDGSIRYLDIGSFCYTVRGEQHNSSHGSEKGWGIGRKVDLTSFRSERVRVIAELVEHLRSMSISADSVVRYFYDLRYFFNWIDDGSHDVRFDAEDSILIIYAQYTQYLLHRIRLSGISGRPLKEGTAQQHQKAAAKIASLVVGIDEMDVLRSCTIFSDNNRNNTPVLPPDLDERNKTFAAHLAFFKQAAYFILNEKPFPLKFLVPSCESYIYYSHQQNNRKSDAVKIAMQEKWLSWSEVNAELKSRGMAQPEEDNLRHRKNYLEANRRLNEINNNPRELNRILMASKACVSFSLAFIGVTGVNLSVLQSLEIETTELITSTKGMRLSGLKVRANNKIVRPEFGAMFTPYYKLYLKLREWLLNGEKHDLAFLALTKTGDLVKINNSVLMGLRRSYTILFPSVRWITPTELRKGVNLDYLNISKGDIQLTAEKMGHAVNTERRYYARANFKQASDELTNYLKNIHHTAIANSRNTNTPIPVNIIEDEVPATPAGHCDASGKAPTLAGGFNDNAPQPNCAQPESCLFCQHYSIHADEQDVRRLLSIKEMLSQIKPKALNHDHFERDFAPVLHRIDEVINHMVEAVTDCNVMIDRVAEEVERGELDPFWSSHFDFLVEMDYLV